MTDLTPVRRSSRLVEAVHAVVYFAPEVQQAYRDAGLGGFWRGYFAGRAAALAAASPELVTALFAGFSPTMVRRALPDVWTRVTPDAVLCARAAGVQASLARLLDGVDVHPAAEATAAAVAGLDLAHRPMAAAQAALPRPDDPLLALWHDCTVLREHRGDAHLAVVTASGLQWPEPHLLLAGLGRLDPRQQEHRGWDDERWRAALARLQVQGWLSLDGSATADGEAAYGELEQRTDALTSPAVATLIEVLAPLAARTTAALPFPNAMGLPPAQ
jgi:hypothetical protein